jgi:hypothetical protein
VPTLNTAATVCWLLRVMPDSAMAFVSGFRMTTNVGFTCWINDELVDPRKPALPKYSAVMLCVPMLRPSVAKVAVPPLNVPMPRVVAPSLNVTEPLGTK